MNKSTSKDLVKKMGLMTADQELLRSNQSHDSELLKKFQKKYSHIVLKPACDGSSSGLSFLSTTEECNEWIKNQFKSQNLWLAEERIIGRELTVGVINHQKCLTVLPPSEVVLERNAHFDYLAKYQGKGNKEITPAILTPKETVDAQTVAILAHSALHCSGYTRTDMIMNDRGMYYLETNTLPGMTKASFIPQQLNAANIDLKLFINGQLEWAKTRYL